MIFNLFGINTLNNKLKELEDKNYAQYCENNRLKKELEAKELDLKIAKMYIDDDEALLELLELSKDKPNTDAEDQLRGMAMSLGQMGAGAQLGHPMENSDPRVGDRNRQSYGGMRTNGLGWGGI